ncbi:helix-turn-helix domain-containing protein [Actinoalloteichus sp. GBA129-24]|uniref:helix-turn-helix domain-containing protein n=1 Tax=Actinoalloteichus sp. GBA129-24 TaxID=1612551 RepID=UPI0009503CFE|nr:helix-turn-helix transcriptional regulator [Actinoalloteichus sp. GBA129-24]APU18749.1 DNA binding protein with helix-turn-helix domain [Actinoalloteichus sp. GBA129-24]
MASKAQARALGAELREARKATGLTMAQVGERIGYSKATMSLTETGKRVATPETVAAILAVLGVTGDRREQLLQMAREASVEPRWLGVGIPGLAPQTTGMAELERTSVRIIDVSPNLVPGLMQTEPYARAIFAGSNMSEQEIGARTTFRMGRQTVLAKPGLTYMAVLDEAVLRRPVGGRTVIADQIDHLIRLSAQPHITIQILPMAMGWHGALEGPFVVLEGEKTHPVIHLEHRWSGLFLDEDDASEVRAYMASAASLQQLALSRAASAELMMHLRDEWKGHDVAALEALAEVQP